MFELIIVLVLVLVNGLFSGAEIALLSVRKTRVQELVLEGRIGARSMADLRAHPERLLATVQIGITVVGSAAAAFGGSSIAGRLAEVLRPVVGPNADDIAFALVVAFVSYLSLVLGELVPKSLALRAAESYALVVAPLLAGLAFVGRPFVWFLTTSSNVVLRLFGDHTSFTESRLSVEELRQLVDEATTAGTVDSHAGDIATRALQFADLTVGDVMVPRSRVVSVPSSATPDDIAEIALKVGHSRLVVYGQDTEDVLGYVGVRDVLARARRPDQDKRLVDQLHPMLFVPASMSATRLLRTLQERASHLAIAVDEQGAMRGLVTLEDLVEELVGDILSEGDKPQIEVARDGDDRWLLSGLSPIREVNRATGWELPDDTDATTIGGLVVARAGHIPAAGEHFDLGPFDAEIVEATPRKIKTVRLTLRRERPAPTE